MICRNFWTIRAVFITISAMTAHRKLILPRKLSHIGQRSACRKNQRTLGYSLLPLRQAPEKLPGQEVDLLHLSDGAKQELSAAAVQQALGDEDVMGLLGLFLGLGY